MRTRVTWLVAVTMLLATCAVRVPKVGGTLDALTGQGAGLGLRTADRPNSTCSLVMTPRRPALRARVGLFGRRRQAEPSKPSRGGGWCDKLEGNEKFHNDRCKTLPTATPSPGCSAFDPADTAAWMPAEPRTVWLWGDSVMLQLWDHLMCFLSHHAEEVSPAGPGDGRYDATSEYGR